MAQRGPKDVKTIVFGPVQSRRLGKSLGINLIPAKSCSLNCIYCELGRTGRTSIRRYPYIKAKAVERDLRKILSRTGRPDYLTFAGAGEPTLNSEIGKIIHRVKKITKLPAAVLTNSTLLTQAAVRRELLSADLVIPSLDAACQKTFEKINRPHKKLKIKNIIKGIKIFQAQFKGEIWLEIMLVKDINDSEEELRALKKAVVYLGPDRVQLNTVVREPAEQSARALTFKELKKAQRFFGKNCEVLIGRRNKRKRIFKKLLAGLMIVYFLLGNNMAWTMAVKPPEARRTQVGEVIPKILFSRIDGRFFSTAKLYGKVTILNFWTTWHPPCRSEVPAFIALYKKYGGAAFEIIGIALDKDIKGVKRFVKEMEIPYPVVISTKHIERSFAEITELPTTFLVDKKGRIRFRYTGYTPREVFEKKINFLLKE